MKRNDADIDAKFSAVLDGDGMQWTSHDGGTGIDTGETVDRSIDPGSVDSPVGSFGESWLAVAREAWESLTGDDAGLPDWFDELTTVTEMARKSGHDRQQVQDALDAARPRPNPFMESVGCGCDHCLAHARAMADWGMSHRIREYWDTITQEARGVIWGNTELVTTPEQAADAILRRMLSIAPAGVIWGNTEWGTTPLSWSVEEDDDDADDGPLIEIADEFAQFWGLRSEQAADAIRRLMLSIAPEQMAEDALAELGIGPTEPLIPPRPYLPNRAQRRGQPDRPGHVSPHGPGPIIPTGRMRRSGGRRG